MALKTSTARKVELHPITDRDIPKVAAFLNTHLNAAVSADSWARAMNTQWAVEQPNHGFMLTADDAVVGANLAFYSERIIRGETERICNLGAWCVLEGHRLHALRLVKAILGQSGYHFTDLSPSGSVPKLNEKLGFAYLDTTTAIVPNLPWPGRAKVSSNSQTIERALTGHDLQVYKDHKNLAAARHLVATARDGRHCHIIFRKDRRKGLPLFASILYVSDADVFRTVVGPIARHLLTRHGLPLMLLEQAVTDHTPRLAKSIESPRRKMFKSDTLVPADIDYLYSELVCLSW